MRISVVVATHERRESVLRCLRPVLSDSATSEVIVVVDGSRDGTADALRAEFGMDRRLRVVETEPRGQARAQDHGADLASGDVLLFLDDDVELAPGVISGHLELHEQDAADLVVGYMPCDVRALRSDEWPVRHYAAQYERKIRLWVEDPTKVLAHLWGGNVSIRTTAWRALPPYPGANALPYHMDWELGLRCAWSGLRSRFAPTLAGVHHQRRDLAGFLRDRRRSAAARIEVHDVYRSRLGPLLPSHFTQDCSGLTRHVIDSRSASAALALTVVWALGLRVASVLRLPAWQRRCALDLTSLEGSTSLRRSDR